MAPPNVTFDREPDRPHVGHLRVDVDEMNRLTAPRLGEIHAGVEAVPDDVSVVTVAAAGDLDDARGFAAGLDLTEAVEFSTADARELFARLHATAGAVRDLDAVTVCACGGYAIGAGLELAMAADFRVATAESALGLPEVDVGIPTVLYGALLPLFVGYGDAAELVFLGDPFSGERAAESGLVHEAPPESEYAATVEGYVDRLAEKSPPVLRYQKRVARTWRSNGLEAAVESSVAPGLACFSLPDREEAMRAFLADRDPVWQHERERDDE
ncbi:MAG: enoyl-CoA hydratase/isomerase family protein [Haloferacaceae archaeon]